MIELKTEIVDVNELLGVLDRKTRLAARVARERGWAPAVVSTWLVVADSSANRTRATNVDGLLRAALPLRGRAVERWLRAPSGRVAGLTFLQNFSGSGVTGEFAGRQRVRTRRPSVGTLQSGRVTGPAAR